MHRVRCHETTALGLCILAVTRNGAVCVYKAPKPRASFSITCSRFLPLQTLSTLSNFPSHILTRTYTISKMSTHSPSLEYLMSQLTLGREPKNITVDKFHDILISQPTLLNILSIQLWTKLAQQYIGEEAWEAAYNVLIYQRHQDLGIDSARAAVTKDLKNGFILRREEIRQLLANHQFFAICSENFSTLVLRKRTGLPTTWAPSFTAKDVLQAKIFYRTWLTSFYFEYESIASLASLKTLSTQEYADVGLICHLMRDNDNSGRFGCSPKKKCGLFEDYRSSGFFNISFCADAVLNPEHGSYEVNPALFLKMVTQIRATCTSLDGDFLPKFVDFMWDYPKMTTEELIKKYSLKKGAEFIAWAQLELEWEKDGLTQVVLVKSNNMGA